MDWTQFMSQGFSEFMTFGGGLMAIKFSNQKGCKKNNKPVKTYCIASTVKYC